MSAIESIIKWASETLPSWQSDVVRRLLTQDELTKSDEDEIINMIKKIHGLVDIVIEPRPLKRGEISGDTETPVNITLKAMKELNGVNAIPDGTSLNFGHQGLNVVYGENGAGKSGYARVLKRACRARDKKEKIYSNVFTHSSTGQASATFKISVNDGPEGDVFWIDGQEDDINILTNIHVFDSKCARVIVDDNNEVTYLPYGAHVFETLVDLIKKIKIKLENEKPKIEKLQYSDISLKTEIGQFINRLNDKTTTNSIEELAKWSDEDKKTLSLLIKSISEAELNDPGKAAKKIRNLKDRVKQFHDSIEKMDKVLSPVKAELLEKKITGLINAEKAAILASQETLSEEPLCGTGESAWQLLYNAAKKYSIELAYSEKDFPVTEDGLCVLCMQPLSDDAKARMLRFKNFMEDSAQKQVETALVNLQSEIKEIRETPIPKLDSIKDIIDEIRERDSEIAIQLEEYLPTNEIRVNEMIKCATEKRIFPYTPSKISPIKGILKIIDNLEDEAKEVEKSANPEDLTKKKNQKLELEARKLFTERKQNIIDYVSKLQLLKKYDNCIISMETKTITQQGKKIVSGALTPLLRSALDVEIKALGASHLPLNLKPSGSDGETRHKMELDGCLTKKVSLSDVLSEGEQRVVAIAGFMAELKIGDNKSPIVLDDPVSSLDHRYREKIAERIIREAVIRQVIVFTHDIAFLLTLRSKAGEMGVCFCPQTIRKTAKTAGNSMEGLPWHAMNVKDRIKYLNDTLANIQDLYVRNQEEYNRSAGFVYSLIRETWESFIEEVLFFEAIRRHSGEIQTMRLKSVTVTTEDYKIIHINMSKSSTWMTGHDKSKALDVNRPSPEEILDDINALKSFSKEIRKRHDELRKERETSLQPQIPEVG